MPIATTETLSLYDNPARSEPPAPSSMTADAALAGFEMLRRGIDAGIDAVDRPDKRYWTAYDHFMVEREARAMRTAYVGALCAKGVVALRKWLPQTGTR